MPFANSGQRLLAPGHRGVPQVGVLRHVDDVDQPLAALPVERGALPGRLLRETAEQGALLLRVEGVEETRRALFLREELRLRRRASLENADQVLPALLARVARLRRPHLVGNVPRENDLPLPALLGDGQVGVVRDVGLDLDEVDAASGEHRDRSTAVFRGGERDRRGKLAFGPVEHRARDDHPRAEELSRFDVAPRLQDRVEVAAHVADARDAVRNEREAA